MHVLDTFVLYQFIRKLSTPFIHWKMYEKGIIDANGDFLQPKELRTADQLASYSYLDVLILNLKKLMGKVPYGSTRIATFAAALYLLREGKTYTDEEYLTEQWIKNSDKYLDEARSMICEDEGGVPVNVASTDGIAKKDNPMNVPKKILRRHKLKEEIVNQSSNDSLGDYDFPMNVPKKFLHKHKHTPGQHNSEMYTQVVADKEEHIHKVVK